MHLIKQLFKETLTILICYSNVAIIQAFIAIVMRFVLSEIRKNYVQNHMESMAT